MIREYLTAGYPALYILTQEPHRAEEMLADESEGKCTPFAWDILRGIREAKTYKVIEPAFDPVSALGWLNDQQDTILFAHNLHEYLSVPENKQAIQNGIPLWKAKGNCLCVIAPTISLPPEVEKFFFALDLPLPDEKDIEKIQTQLAESIDNGIEVNPVATLAGKGLTEFEAETAFAFSVATKGKFDPRVISAAKAQMIKKSGYLQFWPPEDPNNLGGLGNYKKIIKTRLPAFEPGSKLPKLKAILMAGIMGGGKSLAAKCLANTLLVGPHQVRLNRDERPIRRRVGKEDPASMADRRSVRAVHRLDR